MDATIRTAASAVLAALLVATAAVGPVAAGTDSGTESYAGTHVSFGTSGSAVTDYAVGGTTVLSTVKTESTAHYESRTGASLGLDLSALTDLEGAGLSLSTKTETTATVEADDGATLAAHDNAHGSLVVRAGGSSRLVKADVAGGASATAEGDSRVVVTADDGTKGTFVVAGDGTVDVNGEGDVVADLEGDDRLVFRAYAEGERNADARATERMIANGTATGAVYVMSEGGATVADTVNYSDGTSVTADGSAEGEVRMTVDRASHDGKVIVTEVSEAAVGATGDLSVTVDGEAAAEAGSRSELVAATEGGSTSKFMVTERADGTATVLVGIDHFSERTVTMSGEDGSDGSNGSDGSDGDGDPGTSTTVPGFGAVAALIALAAAALVARSR